VLSGRGFCGELNTRVSSVSECEGEDSKVGIPWPTRDCRKRGGGGEITCKISLFFV